MQETFYENYDEENDNQMDNQNYGGYPEGGKKDEEKHCDCPPNKDFCCKKTVKYFKKICIWRPIGFRKCCIIKPCFPPTFGPHCDD